MIFTIFSAYASDREPPKTVKSWLKTKTSRPSMVPWPVTTPSPRTCCVVQPELGRAVGDERVQLDERPRVQQEIEPFAGGQLAPGVLPLDPDRSPAEQRLAAHPLQALETLFAGRHVDLLASTAPGCVARPVLSLRTDRANGARPS